MSQKKRGETVRNQKHNLRRPWWLVLLSWGFGVLWGYPALLLLKSAIPDETLFLSGILVTLCLKDLFIDFHIRKRHIILPKWMAVVDHWGLALVILYLTTWGGWSAGPYGVIPIFAFIILIIDGALDWVWRG